MKLIEHLNGDEDLLKRLSTLMYFMNKEVARNSFADFIEGTITFDEWDLFKEWLEDNGLKTYN